MRGCKRGWLGGEGKVVDQVEEKVESVDSWDYMGTVKEGRDGADLR